MATLRVASTVLEHILDFPEGVEITDIHRAAEDDGDIYIFTFVVEGKNPHTGEELGDEELDVAYTQDDQGIHFAGFRSV